MRASTSETTSRLRTVFALALGCAALYAATLFPGVGGEVNHGDSAKFQFFGVVSGVGHPPGNPLYLLLLALVQRLPFGEPWLRANLTSALCATVAIAFVADATYRVAGRYAAIAAAAALGLGGSFWTFATEAEVYALAAFCVAFVLDALARAETERDGRWVAVAVFGYLLGLSNHLSLVFAFPALLAAALWLARRGVRPTLRQLALALVGGVITLALYVAIPIAHARGLAYSEYEGGASFGGLLSFVSAAKYQSKLSLPTLEAALFERPLTLGRVMLRQWAAPVWMFAPMGVWALARRAPALACFAALSFVGWLAFIFVYNINDIDGFFVPPAVVAAPALGALVGATIRPRLLMAVLAAALLPGVIFHARRVREAVPYDVLEDVGRGPARELLDLPDVIARMPEGALLALPCTHYGCVQVANYYRFADSRARARHIELVTIRGGTRYPMPSPPRVIVPELARTAVVCTIQPAERALLATHGARMRVEDRGERVVAGVTMQREPLYCSVP